MAEEILEAEVIEGGELAVTANPLAEISFDNLSDRIMAINEAIVEARRAADECDTDDEAMAAMGYEDVKRLGTSLNKAIEACEKARKAFNGDYDTPKKRVKLAYDEAMGPVTALYERYKARKSAAEDEIRDARFAAMEEAYNDFMEGNGMGELAEAVPFKAMADDKWWNTVAKNWSEKATANTVVKRAMEIVKDWNAVKATAYHYPEQAQATFLRTLSLREAAEQDQAMWEEAQRVAAVNAEDDANRAYREPEELYDPVPPEAYEPVPGIVAEAEQVVAQAEPATWVLCVDLTPSQYQGMIGWFKANGVHGQPMRTSFHGWEHAAQMVKAVCNG